MDNNIAFSSENAETLNELIQNKIASHLFLSCNYDPRPMFIPINEDAIFITAVLNMYKYFIDSGVCKDLIKLGKKKKYTFDFQGLDRIITIVNAIRTIFSHNISELNGYDEEKKVAEQWFLEILGKNNSSTDEDYKRLLDTIETYGNKSIKVLIDFVDYINRFPDEKKNDAINDWEKLIIGFYKRVNTKKLLEGQLIMFYRSEVGEIQRGEKSSIAKLIKEMFTHEQTILNLQNCLPRISEKGHDLKIAITEKMKSLEESKTQSINQIVDYFNKEPESIGAYDYYNFYLCSKLPNEIEERILNKKFKASLLPQDIVQEIIEEDFQDVPIL